MKYITQFFNWLAWMLSPALDGRRIAKYLGPEITLWNGKSWFYGGDNKELIDKQWLRIGFGKSVSGYGDWGGGFSYATTSPLKVTIDENFIIQKIETDSFYNSKESQRIEETAKKIASRLKVGDELLFVDIGVRRSIQCIFSVLPCDTVISWDVKESPHMLEHYVNKAKENPLVKA